MKTLVLHYSLDGNTRLVAEAIAKAAGADTLELKLAKAMPSSVPMRIVKGGYQVVSKQCPALQPLDRKPGDYDMLFIGSPVWAGCYAPALRSFFARTPLAGRKTALFLCHGGGKGDAFGKLRAALAGNEIVAEIDFVSPLKKNPEAAVERAGQWAGETMAALAGGA